MPVGEEVDSDDDRSELQTPKEGFMSGQVLHESLRRLSKPEAGPEIYSQCRCNQCHQERAIDRL